MKSLMVSAAAAALMSLSAPAFADCAEEIASLKSQVSTSSTEPQANTSATKEPISSEQAGEQAAAAPSEDAPAPAEEEVAAAPAAEATAPAEPAVEEQTAAAAPEGDQPVAGEVAGTEATAAMNEVTENIATSPAEVEEQATAQPAETAPNAEQQADQAAGGEEVATSKGFTSGGEAVNMVEVAVARAEAYQKLGNEGACLNVIEQAATAVISPSCLMEKSAVGICGVHSPSGLSPDGDYAAPPPSERGLSRGPTSERPVRFRPPRSFGPVGSGYPAIVQRRIAAVRLQSRISNPCSPDPRQVSHVIYAPRPQARRGFFLRERWGMVASLTLQFGHRISEPRN